MALPTPSSVLAHGGVLAVVVTTTAEPDAVNPSVIGSAGCQKFVALGSWALQGFDLDVVGDSARYGLLDGEHTVLLERASQGSVAIVLTTAHPVVKSARRIARRLLRSIIREGLIWVPPPGPPPARLVSGSPSSGPVEFANLKRPFEISNTELAAAIEAESLREDPNSVG